MFGQNQDDQQAVVPPPDNVASAPTNTTVTLPEPDDPNIIKPDTASAPAAEPEVQPLTSQTDDDLAIPDDIKDEDIIPTPVPEPAASEPAVKPLVNDDDDQKDTKEQSAVNVTEDGSAYTPFAQDKPAASSDLDELKREALQELSPLVDDLDLAPEEKFSTTMMMIQAANNKDLLPKAYEAAKAIEDDKAKAQALLDVINEINYFSQDKQ